MSKKFADPSKMREITVQPRGEGTSRTEFNLLINKGYHSNKVTTTKYSLLSFLPKSLFHQFSRYANIYFLITAILQSSPYISPLNPFSAIAPLIFVIGVSLLREAIEDYGRYKNDTKLNGTPALVFEQGNWVPLPWKDVHVGDFIKVQTDEVFPADLLVLYAGHSGAQKGTCFIETGSLDGEKTLKQKIAMTDVMDRIDSTGLQNFKCKLSVSPPNSNIHSLEGVIYMDEGKNMPINNKQLLLRGAYLKNTEYVIGVAIYCGADSKIMLNSANSRFKMTKMEHTMNNLILLLLMLQFALIVSSIVGYVLWNNMYKLKFEKFITYKFDIPLETILMCFSYFLIYNTLLPISLMVTIEIAKVFQTYFIGEDKEMYNKEKEKGCKVMTRSINEELGQIEYVFTDKTGTLTCNVMVLKYLTIGQETYTGSLEKKTNKNSKYARENDFFSEELQARLSGMNQEKITPIDASPQEGGASYQVDTQQQLTTEFMTLMAVCHDCVVHMQKQTEHDVIR